MNKFIKDFLENKLVEKDSDCFLQIDSFGEMIIVVEDPYILMTYQLIEEFVENWETAKVEVSESLIDKVLSCVNNNEIKLIRVYQDGTITVSNKYIGMRD